VASADLYEKIADVQTPLLPHQRRAIDKLRAAHGLLVVHGLGSGKTLTSIAAGDELGVPSEVVAPAPLVRNYDKELKKHLGEVPKNLRVRSYEQAARDGGLNTEGLVVFDEAHKGRNSGTGAAKMMEEARRARYRMLLTATPVYNSPADLANLINTVAGRSVLPDDHNLFKQTFVGTRTVQAPFLTRLKGQILGHPVDTVTHPALINRERLVQATKGYVDVHKGGGDGFPDRIDEEHTVPMSDRQKELYTFAEGKLPWYLRAKIRAGLPMNKQESKELNAFQGALRQIANTPRGFANDITDENELEHSPKIQKVIDHLLEARSKDPNHRGIIYSNYLDSGVYPLSRALKAAGVEHNVFDGSVPTSRRAQMVNDYNSGKTPVMLLSGAGSEGLDLKGTKTMQLLEPHWHDQRPAQVIGRGIRYLSHAHLPEAERKVRVMKYYSTLPKDIDDRLGSLAGMKPKQSIEQYLKHMSDEKTLLTDEIAGALQEASDAGPLQKKGGAGSDDLMQAIADRMGDATLGTGKGKKHIEFTHPTGIKLQSPYDAHFIQKNIDDTFEGDRDRFADQLRDDMLNMGYATLGGVAKKNEQKKRIAGAKGIAFGSLAGSVLPLADMLLRKDKSLFIRASMAKDNALRGLPSGLRMPLSIAGQLAIQAAPSVALGSVGFHLGRALSQPLGTDDVVAKNTHPLLIPPKPVKAKVRLEVKEK
jgi:superfamily II DNA or RNA helicase